MGGAQRHPTEDPLLKRLAGLSFLLIAACGDNSNPNAPDANGGDDAPDANPDDPDAEPAVTTHTATISILDVRVNTAVGAVGDALGSGGQVVASVTPAEGDVPGVVDAVGQIFDNRDATGVGCAAFVWDLTASQLPPVTENHGTVTITGSAATIPPCNFVGSDYACVATSGAGGATSAITPDPDLDGAGGNPAVTTLSTITVVGASFSAADVGRYIKISGATHYRNNGAFPIVGFSATPAPTLIYGNPPAAAQVDLTGVTYAVVAGAGPVPTGTDFLADTDSVTVALDAPNGDPFEDFTTDPAVGVGDNFSLTPTSSTLIHSIPVDGTTFTLGCDPNVFTLTNSVATNFDADAPAADDVTINATGIGANTRVGAEVTITGSTTAANNGTYTITARTANTITYVNANAVDEGFAAGTTVVVGDCGSASVSAVNVDFSNAALIKFISAHAAGTGPTFTDGTGTCTVTNPGMFQVGLAGAFANITGATTAGNNGERQIATSTADSITLAGDCDSEAFAATTAYEVYDKIDGATTSFLMPDPATAHATKIGHIQCAALASQTVVVPAGAAAALMMVDPNRIRTTFVRSGLAQGANADGTNPINILPGHAIVGFTTVP